MFHLKKRLSIAWKLLTNKHVIVFTMGNDSENGDSLIITNDKIFLEESILFLEKLTNSKNIIRKYE